MIERLVLRLLQASPILAVTGSPLSAHAQDATPDVSRRTTRYAFPTDLAAALPGGTAGGIDVVAHSDVLGRGDRVIAIVRNATERPVSGLTVATVVRDMSRKVVALGASSLTAPVVLPPDGLAMVRVPLGGHATPEMAVEVTVAVSDPDPDGLRLVPAAAHPDRPVPHHPRPACNAR